MHNTLADQNPGIITQYEECNLDSNAESVYFHLKRPRLKHFNRSIIAHLNIGTASGINLIRYQI